MNEDIKAGVIVGQIEGIKNFVQFLKDAETLPPEWQDEVEASVPIYTEMINESAKKI